MIRVGHRVGVVAACGGSGRTGLGAYTTKAALRLWGKSLLAHQIEFLRASGCDRALVVAVPEHARLLARGLSEGDRAVTAFLLHEPGAGWAGTVERAQPHVDDVDEVLLVSCDNFHNAGQIRPAPSIRVESWWAPLRAEWLTDAEDALFTYTTWDRGDRGPTDGPVLGRAGDGDWCECLGKRYVGDLFTGYAVVRGRDLFRALADLPVSEREEKEFTALLEKLARRRRSRAVAYPGTYEDVRDLHSLARLDAGYRADGPEPAHVGAGVLLVDGDGKVLLTERQDGLGWVMPGGLVEEGESYAAAALRETREEIGIAIAEADLRLLGVYPTAGKDGSPACSVIFWARAAGSTRVAPLLSEVKVARWFTAEEAAAVVIPFNLRGAVDDHFAGREMDCR